MVIKTIFKKMCLYFFDGFDNAITYIQIDFFYQNVYKIHLLRVLQPKFRLRN